MALGQVTSIGFDGNKFLNEEMVSKLQKAEETSRMKMPKKEMDTNTNRQKELAVITTAITKLQSSVKDLADETTFLKRKVNSTGESAELSVVSGVSIQNLDINVKQLAQKDSYQSLAFKSRNEQIGIEKEGTIIIGIDGSEYDIKLRQNTTLQDLADQINSKTNGDVQARIINVGGEKPYQLVIQSAKSGKAKELSFSENADTTNETKFFEKLFGLDSTKQTKQMKDAPANAASGASPASPASPGGAATSTQVEVTKNGKKVFKVDMSSKQLTKAQDAEFAYNGLSVTRASNTIDDLRSGVTLTLKKLGESSFNIVQDNDGFKESLNKLVTEYNDLMNKLDTAQSYNSKTKAEGIFNGVEEITAIRKTINNALTKTIRRERTYDEKVALANSLRKEMLESRGTSGMDLFDKNGNINMAAINGSESLRVKTISISSFGISINQNGLLELDNIKFSKALKENEQSSEDDFKNFFVGTKTFKDIYYQGSEINSSELKIEKNDLIINGVSVTLEFKQGNDTKQNAQALLKAINDADIDGISASIYGDNMDRIRLKGANGFFINISGKDDVLKKLGLEQKMVQAQPIEEKGVFVQLKDSIYSLIHDDKRDDRKDGSLVKYSAFLQKENKTILADIDSIEKDIKERFAQLREQFIKYDQITQQIKRMWEPLQMSIDYEIGKK